MKRARIVFPLLACALAMALTACGGDSASDDDADGVGATDGVSEFVIGMTEFTFDPPAISVTEGDAVSVRVENKGSILHDWIVVQQGSEITDEDGIPDEITVDFALASVEVDAGQAGTADFTAPSAGTYQIICAIPGHFTAGMAGELTVDP